MLQVLLLILVIDRSCSGVGAIRTIVIALIVLDVSSYLTVLPHHLRLLLRRLANRLRETLPAHAAAAHTRGILVLMLLSFLVPLLDTPLLQIRAALVAIVIRYDLSLKALIGASAKQLFLLTPSSVVGVVLRLRQAVC